MTPRCSASSACGLFALYIMLADGERHVVPTDRPPLTRAAGPAKGRPDPTRSRPTDPSAPTRPGRPVPTDRPILATLWDEKCEINFAPPSHTRFTQGTARRTNELRQAAAGYSARHAARHAAPCVDAPRPSATWATVKTLRTMIEDFVDAAAHDLFEGCIEEFDGLRVSFSEPAVLHERVAACCSVGQNMNQQPAGQSGS